MGSHSCSLMTGLLMGEHAQTTSTDRGAFEYAEGEDTEGPVESDVGVERSTKGHRQRLKVI